MDRGTYHRARGLFGFSAVSLWLLPDQPSNPTAPKGQSEIAQSRAKRRPGHVWPVFEDAKRDISRIPARVGIEKKVTQIGYATLMVIGLNR